jgi:hypothetical protein
MIGIDLCVEYLLRRLKRAGGVRQVAGWRGPRGGMALRGRGRFVEPVGFDAQRRENGQSDRRQYAGQGFRKSARSAGAGR